MNTIPTKMPIPEFTQNDVMLRETLVKIYAIMWTPKQSPAHRIINKAKMDQLVLHLMAAPEFLLPSC